MTATYLWVTGKKHQYTEHAVVHVETENIKKHRKQEIFIKHYNVNTLCNHIKFIFMSAEDCTAF